MRAYRIGTFGDVAGITASEEPKPEPGPGQVLVRLHAPSLNRRTLVKIPPHLSFEEAATLPCPALTAWSALTGPRPVLVVNRTDWPEWEKAVRTLTDGGVDHVVETGAVLVSARRGP